MFKFCDVGFHLISVYSPDFDKTFYYVRKTTKLFGFLVVKYKWLYIDWANSPMEDPIYFLKSVGLQLSFAGHGFESAEEATSALLTYLNDRVQKKMDELSSAFGAPCGLDISVKLSSPLTIIKKD
jgi:hypothetical protein